MPRAPICQCEACPKCARRARNQRYFARKSSRAIATTPAPSAREPSSLVPTDTEPPRPPAVPVALDALLSDWRRNNPGSIVHVGQSGVTLYAFGREPLRFADTDAAIGFLSSPTSRAS